MSTNTASAFSPAISGNTVRKYDFSISHIPAASHAKERCPFLLSTITAFTKRRLPEHICPRSSASSGVASLMRSMLHNSLLLQNNIRTYFDGIKTVVLSPFVFKLKNPGLSAERLCCRITIRLQKLYVRTSGLRPAVLRKPAANCLLGYALDICLKIL
ncbi:hypothetical protein [Candidatus Desulfovibrio trichonymphae]|uniref:hypothetical protein n=1 Tax=Candidatus Desulfovibrio trichonymphae TaxID=1725232 RepID=UPI0011AB57C8|nr:hypothetical protein [Candidatus Desulfovibrio trichonymphae]